MSYSWYGKVKKQPTLADLDRLFRTADANARICVGEQHRGDVGGRPYILRSPEGSDDLTQPFIGKFVNVYVPKKSAAGIEVTWDEELGLRIRCMALASDEDYDLALSVVDQLTTDNNKVSFSAEEGEAVDPSTMARVYGPEFRFDQQCGGCESVALRADQLKKGGWFIVQTPVRPLFVDATFFKTLKKESERSRKSVKQPGARLTQEVLARLKYLVALSSGPRSSGAICPNKIKVLLEGQEVVGEVYVVGTKTILCESDDHVIVSAASAKERLVLTWSKFASVVKQRAQWLDARQILTQELSQADIDGVFVALSKKADAVYVIE